MQCATHPSVETELACGKCGKAICPRCLVQTPVGARCRDCAQLRRLPQFEISPAFLARGFAAALGVGAALGAVWALLLPFSGSIFFALVVGLGVGYGAGEAVSLATNRKTGPQLQAAAVAGVVTAYIVRSAIVVAANERVELADVVSSDVFGYAVTIMAIIVAMGRVRR
ncbi:MAG: hypothetical protein WEB04_06150 [Dehalococcoidia bacterium]